MGPGELLLIAMRWAHGLATIVWLGGGAYATLIQGPQLRQLDDRATAARISAATGAEFGRWVDVAMIVFVVSGVVLTFDRLSSRGATTQYGIVLALKVALALWMFGIVQGFGARRRGRLRPSPGRVSAVRGAIGSPRAVLWLGAIVVLLAAILKTLYENALRGT
jgi:uncharacterized membrane protein